LVRDLRGVVIVFGEVFLGVVRTAGEEQGR